MTVILDFANSARRLFWPLPDAAMTIEMRQQRFKELANSLARVADSTDTYEMMAAQSKAILKEMAQVVAGFPAGKIMSRAMQGLVASIDINLKHSDITKGNGLSHRAALQRQLSRMAKGLGAQS